jgi:Ca2+-binding EF-hand superfamily protein
MHKKNQSTVRIALFASLLVLIFSGAAFSQPDHGEPGKRFIQRFDTNGDGQVTKDEFCNGKNLFTHLDANGDGVITESEADLLPWGKGKDFIKRYDANGDGQVTKEEFCNGKNRYNMLDANGDGLVTAEEAAKAAKMHRRKGRHMDFIKRFDANGDGQVTKEEFCNGKNLFNMLDANHDGVLTAEEAAKMPWGKGRQGN